jgi:predicted TIM-barrel fold metal-dependent hydrolase
MTRVVDIFQSLRNAASAARWAQPARAAGHGAGGHAGNSSMFARLGPNDAIHKPRSVLDVIAELEAAGADMALINGNIGAASKPGGKYENYSFEDVLQECSTHVDRVRATMGLASLENIGTLCRTIELHASNPAFAMVGIVPTMLSHPANAARLYPIYERCEALKIPVRINQGHYLQGVPGRVQDPRFLDEVLIEFPELVVIASHMGRPWEHVLLNCMHIYENLYLSNSTYLPTDMRPEVIDFLRSDIGRHRMIFGTGSPVIALSEALAAARALDLDDETEALYLGGNMLRILSARDPMLADA